MHIVSIWLCVATPLAPAALGSVATPHPVCVACTPASPSHFVATNTTAAARAQKKRRKPAVPRPQKQTKSEQSTSEAPPAPVSLPPPPPLPAKYRGVALFPLEASEVDPALLQKVQQTLQDEIDEIPGLQSISPEDVRGELSATGLSVAACDRDLGCLSRAGRYSRAHLALEARVSALGGVPTVSLRLIDTVAGKEVARAAEALATEERVLLLQLHRMAVQLLTPEAYVGSLSISCPAAGAEVYLDDKLLGTTPLPSQANLPAGLHVLRLSKPGYSDINRFVDVVYNRASTVQADFNNAAIAGVVVEQVSTNGFGELNIISEEPGLEVRVDGEPVGVTPLRGSVTKVAAGHRRVTLRKPGQQPLVQELDVKSGQRTDAVLKTTDHGLELTTLQQVPSSTAAPTAEAVFHPKPPPPPPLPPQGLTWRFYTGIGGMAVGAACLVGSGLYAHDVALFNSEAKSISDDPQQDSWSIDVRAEKQARLAQLNKEGPQAELREWVFLGAGGLLLGGGAALFIYDLVHAGEPASSSADAAAPAAATSLKLVPVLQPSGAGLLLRGRW